MRFLIFLIFLISNSFAIEASDIKNLVINKDLKKYKDLTFLDDQNNQIDLNDYKGNLILLNFWNVTSDAIFTRFSIQMSSLKP